MEPAQNPRSVIALSSVKQMRALAHPLRMKVLGELRASGPRTVGQLAELFHEAPGTLSYHLRKLAEFGFVEEADDLATDRRERWWRSVHEYTDMTPPGPDASAVDRNASAALRHQVIDEHAATLHQLIDDADRVPAEWQKARFSGDTFAFLTAEELAEASAELRAVADKWHERGTRGRPGAEPAQIILHAFRRPDHEKPAP